MKLIFNRYTQVLIDIIIIVSSFILAYILRFDGIPQGLDFKHMLFQLPSVSTLTLTSYLFFSIYRRIWRYTSLNDIKAFLASHSFVAIILLIARLALPEYYHYAKVPISIIIINFTLVFMASVGVRAIRRIINEWSEQRENRNGYKTVRKKVILIGAGRAGTLVAREMNARPDLNMELVAIIDDNPQKRGRSLGGIKIYGPLDNLPALVETTDADELIITISSASGLEMQRIKKICDRTELPVKILPGMYELIDGSVNVNRIRNVEPEDLLGRESVQLDMEAIKNDLYKKRVMVTGAGGSIGREMCRQVCRFEPEKLILVEQAENNLFEIEGELKKSHPAQCVEALIADIVDQPRMENVFRTFKPAVVINAAAHKHVPLMEANPGEAVKNNIFGTKCVADLASKYNASKFIMISTDKAVNPSSIMGTTKRVAEIYIQSLNAHSNTEFIAVRFGNVLGSAGSVIPIFKKQIKNGGPVTVTDPEMKRYFMSIPEASQLVLQAASLGVGGEIFILDMGEPVKIVTLAEDIIRFSGFKPYEDIEIIFTGTRPGEKLFEELSVQKENITKTRHDKIFIGQFTGVEQECLESCLKELAELKDGCDRKEIRTALKKLVPEANFID